MTDKTLNIVTIVYILFIVCVIVGVFADLFTFGLGLGDLGMLGVLSTISILICVTVYFKKNISNFIRIWNWMAFIIIALIVFYTILY